MVIKPSTCLEKEYNDISEFCKKENQPVFLTKDGEGDLVVMSLEEYSYREEALDIWEKLLEAEAAKMRGEKAYTIEEIDNVMEDIINARI